jgi:hypothetical protein
MKKFLLLIFIVCSFVVVKAQQDVVINEIYPDPSAGNEEYIELYNTTSNPINLDCYTLVSYYNSGTGGAWVYQLPNVVIPAFGHIVFSQAIPISHQGGTYNGLNQYSWNAAGIGTFSSLTQYTRTGNTLNFTGNGPTTDINDFIPIVGGNSSALAIMLFKGSGALVNAFFANNSGGIPASILNLTSLPITLSADAGNGCNGNNILLNFSGIAAPAAEVFDLNSAPGTDNGYRRTRDGFCGTWEKNEPANTYTPGTTNGSSGSSGSVSVAASLPCNITAGSKTLTYTVNSGGPATAYPVTVVVYEDFSDVVDNPLTLNVNESRLPNGIQDDADVPVTTQVFTSTGGSGTYIVNPVIDAAAYPLPWPNPPFREPRNFYVVFQTPSGCYDNIILIPECSALPVKLNGFDARRFGKDVVLTWNTTAEESNKGFDIERANGSGGWEKIGFVESQAVNGGGSGYQYTDFNNILKGISQYRLKQIDLDNRSSYSSIRSVRGEGLFGKTIVYPNPSNDGSVNVVFEDGEGIHNVTLIDMNGRTIKQWKGVTNNNIKMDNLHAGMYTVRIVNTETNEQVVEKIVVNKR